MDKLIPQFVGTNIELIKSTIVSQIEDSSIKILVNIILDKVVETSFVLTDEATDNKAQLREVWLNVTNNPNVVVAFEQLFITAIQKIEDQKVRTALLALTPEIVKTLVAVTDNVPQDGKQIEKIWKDFIKSPTFVDLLLTNIGFLLEALKLPEWLQTFIKRATK